jgi:pimeloyl-ACP methyl ester carboxylesterase
VHRFYDIGANHVEEDGAGEPVILIHGLTLDCRMWQPQVRPLSVLFRVIRYDLRGFGRSADPDPAGPPYRDRDDLAALLDALGIPSAHLVALSRGGRVALEFALHYPGRARRLVLINPALQFRDRPVPQSDSVADIRLRVSALADEGRIPEARDHWLTAPIWWSPRGGIDPLVRTIVGEYFANHQWDSTSRETDLEARDLPHVEARTLVMVGALDEPAFQESARLLKKGLPRCDYLSVPAAGHLANIDNPGVVNGAIISFLKAEGKQD